MSLYVSCYKYQVQKGTKFRCGQSLKFQISKSHKFIKNSKLYLQINAKVKVEEVEGLDLTPDERHKHLKAKFVRYMAWSPQEVYFWRQFGFNDVPADVMQAFRDDGLYKNKDLRKMKIKGKARKSTVIPETEPPNPILYICENYPDACPVKYRRKIIARQCDPTHDEFWWARGYWDGVPTDIHNYQSNYCKLSFTERQKSLPINELIEQKYPDIKVDGKKLNDTYFERPEFREMLERERKKLQSKIKPIGSHCRLRKQTKRNFLVTWSKVLEYRKIQEETLRILIEKKQQENQRDKVMQKFQLEVKQSRNRMEGQSRANSNSARNSRKQKGKQGKKFQKINKQSQVLQKPTQNQQQQEIYGVVKPKDVEQHVNKLQSILDSL